MMECVGVEDDRPVYELRFDAAVKVIQSLPPDGCFQPSNDMMLRFYSYYKQATLGPCNLPRPGFWDPVGKAKWDAWNSLEQMTREEAMTAYVEDMKLILEGMPVTDEVEALLKVLAPFYELVDEKRRISQVSDLTPGTVGSPLSDEGFGTLLSSMPSKSVVKSIIRTMEMNGTLETRPPRPAPPNNHMDIKQNGEEAQEDEEDEEEEEVEIKEVKKVKKAAASQPKKRARKPRAPTSNGHMANGVAHLANGGFSSKSALNGDASELPVVSSTPSPRLQLNGHRRDSSEETSDPHHLASDSDSEVYCDSMDQFGLEEGSEERVNSSISLGLDEEEEEEEEGHSSPPPQGLDEDEECPSPPSPQEDPAAPQGPGEAPGPPEGIQCGGEDGGPDAGASERRRLSADRPDSSLVRRGRGPRPPRSSPREEGPLQGSAGDGGRWGGPGGPGGRLDQQIVAALARLQEDMQSVLSSLEALTAAQARSLALHPNYTSTPAKKSTKRPSWWPFDVSPGAVAFAVVWPFVVQWLLRLYLQRRRRRIN